MKVTLRAALGRHANAKRPWWLPGVPLARVARFTAIQRANYSQKLQLFALAMEVGIEPTVRHAADLGYIPVIVHNACGAGHEEAGERSIACVKYSGDAVFTDVETICNVLTGRRQH